MAKNEGAGKGAVLVSVIISNYNNSRYLEECINSARKQTYKHLEIIVVDDGSTDDSVKIIKALAAEDKRIRLIEQDNGGQASAMNTGFAASGGEIISFMDSDDFWAEDKIERTLEVFANGEYVLVQHNCQIVDGSSQKSSQTWPNVVLSGDILTQYFAQNRTGFYAATSGISCTRQVLEKIFPLDEEEWRICADVALTRPVPIFGQIYTFKDILGYYRVHDSNEWMNSPQQNDFLNNELRAAKYTNKWLEKEKINDRIDVEKIINLYLDNRTFSLDESTFMLDYIKEETKFGLMFDVGAHRGSVSYQFLAARWKVHAFEPNPDIRDNLEKMLEKYDDLTLCTKAASNIDADDRLLYTSEVSSGISSLHNFHDSHQDSINVETITLRRYCEENKINYVDFVKIDTEGHDLFVLQGFPWEKIRPRVVICEFEDIKTKPLGYDYRDMADYLVDKGYEVIVSEWFPITRYGAVCHSWRNFKQYPCQLDDNRAWGNLIAVRDKIDWARLVNLQLQKQFLLKKKPADTPRASVFPKSEKIPHEYGVDVEKAFENGELAEIEKSLAAARLYQRPFDLINWEMELLLRKSKWLEAAKLAEEALLKRGENHLSSAIVYTAAREFCSEKDEKVASKTCDPLDPGVLEKKENLRAVFITAEFLMQRKCITLAGYLFEKALKLTDSETQQFELKGQYHLASIAKKAGNNQKAVEGFKWLLREENYKNLEVAFQSSSFFHLGELLFQQNKREEASGYLKKCLELNPAHNKAQEYLKQCLAGK